MNSKMMIAALGTGGIGLPDRDYYLRDDARFTNIRKQYVDHVAKMLALAGEDPALAAADAGKILAFETRLAKAQLTRVEQRDPHNTYHIRKTADLQAEARPSTGRGSSPPSAPRICRASTSASRSTSGK